MSLFYNKRQRGVMSRQSLGISMVGLIYSWSKTMLTFLWSVHSPKLAVIFLHNVFKLLPAWPGCSCSFICSFSFSFSFTFSCSFPFPSMFFFFCFCSHSCICFCFCSCSCYWFSACICFLCYYWFCSWKRENALVLENNFNLPTLNECQQLTGNSQWNNLGWLYRV